MGIRDEKCPACEFPVDPLSACLVDHDEPGPVGLYHQECKMAYSLRVAADYMEDARGAADLIVHLRRQKTALLAEVERLRGIEEVAKAPTHAAGNEGCTNA
jgi:hypothetical protein